MYENEDQTVSQFFIAAPSKIMYLYEVKVENLVLASSLESNNDGNDSEELERELDAAYAAAEEAVAQEPITAEDNTEAVEEAAVEEATVEESAFEEVAVEESVVEEAPEAIEEAVPAEENGEEDDGYAESAASAPVADDTFTVVGDDGKEHVVYVRYRKSYMARLIQSDDELKSCYAAVKNELLSYKKVKARVSWSTESFNAGRIKCAKLAIRGKSLWLYLNLDPKNYENTKYRFTDNSDKSKYKDVPFGFKVKSARSLKYARELIADMMAKLELSALVREAEEYNIPYEDTVDLIDRELIKVVYSGDITDDATFAEANIGEMLKNMLKNRAEQSEQSVVQEVAPTEEVEGSETSPSVPSSVDETLTVLDEEGKEHIVYVRYRRSYTARLIQSSDSLKDAYNTVKNELLSYKKLKARTSWSAESFNAGRVKCAKLAIRGKALWLYLNLDPKAYEETKYRFVDNSAKPKYKDVPFAIKLKSARSIKYAKELITAMMENLLIARIEREAEDYRMPYEDNLALVDKELIRVAYSGDITDGATFTKANISEMLRSMSEEKQN
jgi:hypothetical protein